MLRGGARNFYGKVSIGHLHIWTPPNKRFQPTAFGAGMRGAFCQQSRWLLKRVLPETAAAKARAVSQPIILLPQSYPRLRASSQILSPLARFPACKSARFVSETTNDLFPKQ